MKKFILLSLTFLTFGVVAFGQVDPKPQPNAVKEIIEEQVPKEGPNMEFESTVVDYGTITQNSEPLRVAKFTNTGTEPLIIKGARGSCGCTVPTYPKEPIMPGESGIIEIRYATNRLGKINKTVKITTNEGSDPHVLSVVGNILKSEEDQGVPKKAPSMLNDSGKN